MADRTHPRFSGDEGALVDALYDTVGRIKGRS
jgi:hypothetical protein